MILSIGGPDSRGPKFGFLHEAFSSKTQIFGHSGMKAPTVLAGVLSLLLPTDLSIKTTDSPVNPTHLDFVWLPLS
jgi:hypothetical protein